MVLTELNDRFNELNLSLLCSLEALIPTSTEFLNATVIKPFLLHYELSEAGFISEAATASNYLLQQQGLNEYHSDTLHKVYYHLSQVPGCFPTIITCYQIALTIGISSARAEEFFFSSENKNISPFHDESGPPLKPCFTIYRERFIVQTLEGVRPVGY